MPARFQCHMTYAAFISLHWPGFDMKGAIYRTWSHTVVEDCMFVSAIGKLKEILILCSTGSPSVV